MFSSPERHKLSSLVKQVSHPPFKKCIFCLADNRKNPLRNLFNVLSKTLCYHGLQEAYLPHLSYTVPISCLGENQHSVFHLEHFGIIHGTCYQTSLALPLVSVFSGTHPFSTQLITLLQTLSLACSSAILIMPCWMCCISFTPPFKLNHRFLYLIELCILVFG